MKVSVYKPDQHTDDRGNFCLWYGDSGVGKTATPLQTMEDPITWIIAERGQVDLTIKAIQRPDIRLVTAHYEGWDDLLEYIYDIDNFTSKKIKSVHFDSLTHIMGIHLADEILEENYGAMARDKDGNTKDIEKALTMRVKMSQEGFGTMSKQMVRLMLGFEQLTIAGIDVHLTARTQDSPKWNRELACAPALAGREFGKDMKGFFDFIGLVERRQDDEGNIIYPPYVSCEDNGSYLSKWTGVRPAGGIIRVPFNVKKMLDYAHGR